MDDELPDPSDWLLLAPSDNPLRDLAPVDSALRCQICKDVFMTPVLTSCSHTFCSLCIRRCLTNDGKCPTCRATDQETRLRPNWQVQELVEAFGKARPGLLELGRSQQKAESKTTNRETRGKKRKMRDVEADESPESTATTRRRSTRAQSKVIQDTDGSEDGEHPTDDGLVPCPICNERMKEEAVFPHLSVHDEGAKPRKPISILSKPSPMKPRIHPSQQPPDRLSQLNYSLLTDTALRKKLDVLGIPSHGQRAAAIRRHTEWVNLVNSNADSKTPRGKRELLSELDTWERSTHGKSGGLSNGFTSGGGSRVENGIMEKDFDGDAWVRKHEGDFSRLIKDARARAKAKPKDAATKPSGGSMAEDTTMTDSGETDVVTRSNGGGGAGGEKTCDVLSQKSVEEIPRLPSASAAG